MRQHVWLLVVERHRVLSPTTSTDQLAYFSQFCEDFYLHDSLRVFRSHAVNESCSQILILLAQSTTFLWCGAIPLAKVRWTYEIMGPDRTSIVTKYPCE